MQNLSERRYKVVLLGDGGVGKTSLVKRFVYSTYDDKYIKTLGVNVYKKEFEGSVDNKNILFNLQIWDVMGQKFFPNVIKESLRDASGVILVCDMTNEETLENFRSWLTMISQATDSIALVFIGNKSDLEDLAFGFHALRDLAGRFDSPYHITSALTGDNVNDAFMEIGKAIYDRHTVTLEDLPDIGSTTHDIPPIVVAEDNIINMFCHEMGGYERAMPMVRKQFQLLGIDFEEPTTQQLDKVSEKLITIVKTARGEKDLHKFRMNVKRYLTGISP